MDALLRALRTLAVAGLMAFCLPAGLGRADALPEATSQAPVEQDLRAVRDEPLAGYARQLTFPPLKVLNVSVYSGVGDEALDRAALERRVREAKEMHATHVGTTIEFTLSGGKPVLWHPPGETGGLWLKRLVVLVNAAHQAGLRFYLGLMLSPHNDEDIQLDTFFAETVPFAEQWAGFSERYQIEQLLLLERATGLRVFAGNPQRAFEGLALWQQAVQALYKGQVGAGVFDTVDSRIDLAGYDFLDAVVAPDAAPDKRFGAYVSRLKGRLDQMEAAARKFQIGLLVVSPLGLVSERDQADRERAGKLAPSGPFRWGTEEEEKRVFEAFFEAVREKASGSRVTYVGPVFGVSEEPAGEVVAKAFKKWKA